MRRAPRGVGARSNRRRPVVLHALPVRPRASKHKSKRRAGTRHRARARGTPQQRPLREAFRKDDRRATDAARTKAAEPQRHVRSWYCSINVRVAPGPRRPLLSQSRKCYKKRPDSQEARAGGVKWEGLSQKLGAALRASRGISSPTAPSVHGRRMCCLRKGTGLERLFDDIKVADLVFMQNAAAGRR